MMVQQRNEVMCWCDGVRLVVLSVQLARVQMREAVAGKDSYGVQSEGWLWQDNDCDAACWHVRHARVFDAGG